MKIHIRNKIKELIPVWNKKGFNGVHLDCNIEGSDEPEDGEQTIEEKAEWDSFYTSFIAEPDFGDDLIEDDLPYVEITVNKNKFWKEFTEMLRNECGSDLHLHIGVNKHCSEVEIYRETDLKTYNDRKSE